ncbi:MAG TPA: porin [Gammaproteobacteria bacterium]|nr:porin [Gammaproteobacteria bacterium]
MITKVLISAASFGLIQPVLAVTDEEFKTLQEQFNQLAEQVDQNSQTTDNATTVGGYGELHYNNLNSSQSPSDKTMDLHRFVLFVNHEFNENIRFFSEFEIEHAFVGDNNDGSGETSKGEVEVEQAYIQFDLDDNTRANAGVLLIPVGILNETHEPPTFYGVERNPIEKNIIPATWWEGGAMLSGYYESGFSYDVALTSGLNSGTNVRGGRQKTAEATADNLAATARVKYTGINGLAISGTVQYQDDMTQDSNDSIGSATLIETHVIWSVSDLTLTGLYARWDIDGSGATSVQKDVQDGAYIEASYKLNPKLGIFVRQNQWDNGGAGDTSKEQTDIGINYWPHENVVLKADYQAQNNIAGDFDGFNLGVGYQF